MFARHSELSHISRWGNEDEAYNNHLSPDNKSITEWVGSVPTTSNDSPPMNQDPAPEGVQTPPSGTTNAGIERSVPVNSNEGHPLRKRNSRANLREGYEQDRPSSKGCNPC